MKIKQKYTNKIIGGSYQYWKDNILANHVEENYDILSHPDIVDVYQIEVKTGIKKYVTTTDQYIAVIEYLNKSDTYTIKQTSAKFDEYYRMIAKPDGMATKEITDALITLINPNKVVTLKENEKIKSEKKMKITEKIFISHSSKDVRLVKELINLIEAIGVSSEDIFCSSFEGYGISLGENFLERLKTELNNNILVIFVLSENFFNSQICLCEMGATWIKTNKHIPILIPPFDYGKIKGVIQNIQGLKINEKLKLNLLKEELEREFNIKPINSTRWESKRDEIVDRINLIIKE